MRKAEVVDFERKSRHKEGRSGGESGEWFIDV